MLEFEVESDADARLDVSQSEGQKTTISSANLSNVNAESKNTDNEKLKVKTQLNKLINCLHWYFWGGGRNSALKHFCLSGFGVRVNPQSQTGIADSSMSFDTPFARQASSAYAILAPGFGGQGADNLYRKIFPLVSTWI